MVLQLDPPAPTHVGLPSGLGQRDAASRPIEPDVPVYRCFLSGGESLFCLTAPSFIGLAGVALVGLPLALMIAGPADTLMAKSGLAISAAVISVALAVLISRWAGRSSGTLAGLLMLAGCAACSCWIALDVMLAAAAAAAAILAYGLAELPSRTEVVRRAPATLAFYFAATLAWIVGGSAPLLAIATVCLGPLLGNGNSRGLRFFLSPVGLATLILGMAIGFHTTAAPPNDLWLKRSGSLAACWPAVVCFLAGSVVTWATVQTGHAASPLGRLLIGWLLGPAVLATVGWIPIPLVVVLTLPAWAAVLGLTLVDLRRRYRAGRLVSCLTSLRTRRWPAQARP